MARKLNAEEHETFNLLLEHVQSSGGQIIADDLSRNLSEKTQVSLKLSPELGIWFGEDVTGLPMP
jgi:hypothetical protein